MRDLQARLDAKRRHRDMIVRSRTSIQPVQNAPISSSPSLAVGMAIDKATVPLPRQAFIAHFATLPPRIPAHGAAATPCSALRCSWKGTLSQLPSAFSVFSGWRLSSHSCSSWKHPPLRRGISSKHCATTCGRTVTLRVESWSIANQGRFDNGRVTRPNSERRRYSADREDAGLRIV